VSFTVPTVRIHVSNANPAAGAAVKTTVEPESCDSPVVIEFVPIFADTVPFVVSADEYVTAYCEVGVVTALNVATTETAAFRLVSV